MHLQDLSSDNPIRVYPPPHHGVSRALTIWSIGHTGVTHWQRNKSQSVQVGGWLSASACVRWPDRSPSHSGVYSTMVKFPNTLYKVSPTWRSFAIDRVRNGVCPGVPAHRRIARNGTFMLLVLCVRRLRVWTRGLVDKRRGYTHQAGTLNHHC